MREYKFRGKCVEFDIWVYGYYVKGTQEDEAYILKNHNWLLGDYFIDVYPETVGQFTGLKDKNGEEIYEGDIVLVTLKFFNINNEKCKVIFHNGSFGIQYGFSTDYFKPFDAWDEVEVIGNIYDNPELLKE